MGNAQFRYPQVLSVPLMSSLVLFFVLFFCDVLEGTTLVVSRGFDDSQLGASTGGQPKKWDQKKALICLCRLSLYFTVDASVIADVH